MGAAVKFGEDGVAVPAELLREALFRRVIAVDGQVFEQFAEGVGFGEDAVKGAEGLRGGGPLTCRVKRQLIGR